MLTNCASPSGGDTVVKGYYNNNFYHKLHVIAAVF